MSNKYNNATHLGNNQLQGKTGVGRKT